MGRHISHKLKDKEKEGVDPSMDHDITNTGHTKSQANEQNDRLIKPQKTGKIDDCKKPKPKKDKKSEFGNKDMSDIKIRKGNAEKILWGIVHTLYITRAYAS